MAFPILHRLLFGNDGAGPKLRSDILPIGDGITNNNGKLTVDFSAAIAEAKLAAYPVGSYYWSSESTDPGTLFGGTWEQIKDRFIYAAGAKSVGETGGAESHVLTVDEIPGHNHTGTSSWHSFDGYFSADSHQGAHRDGGGVVSSEGYYSTNLTHSSSGDDWGTNYHINVRHNHTFTTNNTGGNAAHSTMPPYLVAYCWKRTA
jgi:microcystin-dependent protein